MSHGLWSKETMRWRGDKAKIAPHNGKMRYAHMRLAGALGLLLIAMSFPAAAQWTIVRMPERVFAAIPFNIELDLDCPPPGEAPPPIGCLFPIDVWFELQDRDKSASIPKGLHTVFPFEALTAGPFIFHKLGPHAFDVLSLSLENPDEVMIVGQAVFVVEAPPPVRKKK